jgi:hypothetical protein
VAESYKLFHTHHHYYICYIYAAVWHASCVHGAGGWLHTVTLVTVSTHQETIPLCTAIEGKKEKWQHGRDIAIDASSLSVTYVQHPNCTPTELCM